MSRPAAAWCLVSLALFTCLPLLPAETERPDILLILADDLGIEGLGCYGGVSYPTPHLDALAASGLRFTQAYSQPLCAPTRVQIMTGLYNHRNWRAFGILPAGAATFGHSMQAAGYVTCIAGKWQLTSYDPPDFPGAGQRRSLGQHPKDAGFDEYYLFHALQTEDKGSRYANPTLLENGTMRTYPGAYGEDIWVDRIVDFLDRHRDEDAFVYYPMALPHWPMVPTPQSDAWSDPARRLEEDLRFFPDMMRYMDDLIGRLVARLEEKGLRETTLILFYSDNGTDARITSRLADGRSITGGKAEPTQAGIHVPLIANWPGHGPDGATCHDLIDASDFLPTLLDLAGHPVPDGLDGLSFAAQLRGATGPVRESAFFWYDPRPGWDKERFERHVFALNRNYKLFRDGRFFQLTDRPLEEIPLPRTGLTPDQERARAALQAVIDAAMVGGEPPLVDAFGAPIPAS